MAYAIQRVTEDIILKLAMHAKKITGANNICLAGGVALNCVANGNILKAGLFDDLWIQPAAGDAGGALGAALCGWHMYLKKPRRPEGGDKMSGAYLGPEFSDADIEKTARYTDGSLKKNNKKCHFTIFGFSVLLFGKSNLRSIQEANSSFADHLLIGG